MGAQRTGGPHHGDKLSIAAEYTTRERDVSKDSGWRTVQELIMYAIESGCAIEGDFERGIVESSRAQSRLGELKRESSREGQHCDS